MRGLGVVKDVSLTQMYNFYPRPLRERGSTDGHFLLLLFLLLQTSIFLFLLGTENAMGGHGPFAVMRSCLSIHPCKLFHYQCKFKKYI